VSKGAGGYLTNWFVSGPGFSRAVAGKQLSWAFSPCALGFQGLKPGDFNASFGTPKRRALIQSKTDFKKELLAEKEG
jgi:hypothetical protein